MNARTQITLDPAMQRRARAKAAEFGISFAEYVRQHSGLHFTLGLVELPVFELPQGGRVVCPRVLARTTILQRTVVELRSEQLSIRASVDS